MPDSHRTWTGDAVVDGYPLSRLQLGMLAESDRGTGDVYWDTAELTLLGPFDDQAFAAAVHRTVKAHPVLRTAFELTDFSVPMQLVLRTPAADVVQSGEGVVEDEFHDRLHRPFRVTVHRQEPDLTHVTIGFHHAVMDGWSLSVVLSDILGTYDTLVSGNPAQPLQEEHLEREFVARELACTDDVAHAEHWRERVRQLGTDRLRYPAPPAPQAAPAADATGDSCVLTRAVPDEDAQALSRLAVELGVPLRSALFAVHLCVLSLVQENETAGCGYVANCRPATPDADRGVGVFLNTLPLSVDLRSASWREVIIATHRTLVADERFTRYPIGRISDDNESFTGFDSFVDFREFELYQRSYRSLKILDARFHERTEMKLSVAFRSGGAAAGLSIRALYAAQHLAEPWVDALLEAELSALAHAARTPDRVVTDCELVVASVPVLQPEADEDELEALIASLAQHGPCAAVEDADGVLDRAGLAADVEAVRAGMVRAGVTAGDVVGLALPRDRRHVQGMLAALAQGCAFAPLGASQPAERIASMVGSAGCRWVLAAAASDARLADLTCTSTPVAPGLWLLGLELAADAPRPASGAAYVMFTSGSSGRPKGVVITRSNLSALLRAYRDRVPLARGDKVLAATTFTFDISLVELLPPLAAAGCIVLPRGGWDDPRAIVARVRQGDLRVVQATPSCWRLVLDDLAEPLPGTIAVAGGEVLQPDLAERLVSVFGRVINGYGPTEATIYATAADVRHGETYGIGTPLRQVEARVVAPSSHRQLPVGALGELWLSGPLVSPGYAGLPQETAGRFVMRDGRRWYRTGDLAHRIDGDRFQVVGRIDNQVKINGVRVELEEVEAALERVDVVVAAVCLVTHDPSGDRLEAVLELADGARMTAQQLRSALEEVLPPAMVPGGFSVVDRLPVSPSGKKDRRATAAQVGSGHDRTRTPMPDVTVAPGSYEPQSPVERAVLDIVRTSFGDTTLHMLSRFRDSGGTSMRALRIRMAVWRELQAEVTVGSLFANPTVREVCEALHGGTSDDQGLLVPLNTAVPGATLLLLHPLGGEVGAYADLARQLEGRWGVVAVHAPEFAGADGSALSTIEAIAAHYREAVLRSGLQPDAVGGWCMGATLAYEMWRQWAEGGKELPRPVLISDSIADPVPPSYATDEVSALLGAFGWRDKIAATELAGLPRARRYDRVLQLILDVESTRPGVREHAEIERLVGVYRRHARALLEYVASPPRWIPSAALVRAADEAWEGTLGWEDWVDELSTTVLPGAHDTLLESPYVEALAVALVAELEASRAVAAGATP